MFSNWAYIVKTCTSTFLCSLAYILPRHRGTLYILKDTGTQQEEVKKSMGRALLLLTSLKGFFVRSPRDEQQSEFWERGCSILRSTQNWPATNYEIQNIRTQALIKERKKNTQRMLSDLPWQVMIRGNGGQYFDLFLNSLDSRKMLITFFMERKIIQTC